MTINFHDIFIAVAESIHSAPEALKQAGEALAPVVQNTSETAHATESAGESGGVLGTLGINWKLFLAQLVNFSIILFIFYKWIVKPITNTLAKRQEKIEEGIKNSEYMKDEKRKFEEWKSLQMKDARQAAEKILKTAAETSEKVRQETLGKAQADAAKIASQTMAQLALEKEKMVADAKKELAPIIINAAEKVLKQAMSDEKDKQYAAKVLEDLK